jgi:hypothetical protein
MPSKKVMRKRFETQLTLGLTPISEIKLPTKSRDELAPTLSALQYIFLNPELNEKVFAIVEKKIAAGSKNRKGRQGMTLWEILVLPVRVLASNFKRFNTTLVISNVSEKL